MRLKAGSRRLDSCIIGTVALALFAMFSPGLSGQGGGVVPVVVPEIGIAGDSAQTDRPSSSQLLYGVSPGGAFLRGSLMPGWGHASIKSYTRGGFYFAAESGIAYMLFRTLKRLGTAKDVKRLRETEAELQLRGEGVTDPQMLADGIAMDPLVQDAQTLVDARASQREDWVALAIFFAFFSGADAFVSAHLVDFPEPLTIGEPANGRPGVEFTLSIPWNGPGGE